MTAIGAVAHTGHRSRTRRGDVVARRAPGRGIDYWRLVAVNERRVLRLTRSRRSTVSRQASCTIAVMTAQAVRRIKLAGASR